MAAAALALLDDAKKTFGTVAVVVVAEQVDFMCLGLKDKTFLASWGGGFGGELAYFKLSEAIKTREWSVIHLNTWLVTVAVKSLSRAAFPKGFGKDRRAQLAPQESLATGKKVVTKLQCDRDQGALLFSTWDFLVHH